ncbi:DUF2314 domain-containing protein [Mesorhizobium waimense]|uniref:DUF2314 domain-containing protein n=1 Tax=Mesorhizobium waimense TaxID=1300307 RepID=UPI001FE10570|nr:DUF2314 domain-containing protein [Mesorhizobium waimense]
MIVDGNATEHFWVIPFEQTATDFAGVLANEPKLVQNVVNGKYIKFSRDDSPTGATPRTAIRSAALPFA